ncbi:MAG: FtsX-like permease family protein [Desulfatibacillum sp.]|nr:FtsX-like permease family protein [Desulfatibacillum sp.]
MKKTNTAQGNGIAPDKAQRLLVLPFRKSLEISFKSIQARFFRSLITTTTLVLAISFFSFVMVGTNAANGLLSTGEREYRQALVKSGYDLEPDQVTVGSSPKQRWIAILSLLVCVVGIVNAHLMAVTERFREIGTMKCLGALDRFVMRLFILEAGMQGLAGSLVGALAGAFFALASFGLRFGSPALTHLNWGDILGSVGMAVGGGILLSLLGVMYPAWIASRMQPVEAMRVEH